MKRATSIHCWLMSTSPHNWGGGEESLRHSKHMAADKYALKAQVVFKFIYPITPPAFTSWVPFTNCMFYQQYMKYLTFWNKVWSIWSIFILNITLSRYYMVGLTTPPWGNSHFSVRNNSGLICGNVLRNLKLWNHWKNYLTLIGCIDRV